MPITTFEGNPTELRCSCDFCTGVKKWEDNWCTRCCNVRLGPSKHWENLDMCDECEKQLELHGPIQKVPDSHA